MFLKLSFKNAPTLALTACAILSSCNCAVAQTSVSLGQVRNLPAIDAATRQETSNASRLFTISEKKSLPPVSQFSKARIVTGQNVAPPAQSQSNSAPPALTAVVAPTVAQVAMPQSNVTGNASATGESPGTGYYTISFAQPYKRGQSDKDSPTLGGAGTDDPQKVDVGDDLDDLEASDADELNPSGGELDREDLDDETLEGDDEIDDDDFEDDEDDAPIARPEFGRWPSKSIQEVRLDLVEHGAQSPEDRSNRLFDSARRIDGNVAATEKVFAWAAPNINYQPLYFEDVALERYGQTKGLVKQPFVSAGRFLADRLFLGARALRVCPHSSDSPLGYCRPGSPSTVADGGCGCACLNSPQEDCQSCR